MLLISLLLAATPTPAAKPDVAVRREPVRTRPARVAARSKRLIELEAAVKSLPLAVAERENGSGPTGM